MAAAAAGAGPCSCEGWSTPEAPGSEGGVRRAAATAASLSCSSGRASPQLCGTTSGPVLNTLLAKPSLPLCCCCWCAGGFVAVAPKAAAKASAADMGCSALLRSQMGCWRAVAAAGAPTGSGCCWLRHVPKGRACCRSLWAAAAAPPAAVAGKLSSRFPLVSGRMWSWSVSTTCSSISNVTGKTKEVHMFQSGQLPSRHCEAQAQKKLLPLCRKPSLHCTETRQCISLQPPPKSPAEALQHIPVHLLRPETSPLCRPHSPAPAPVHPPSCRCCCQQCRPCCCRLPRLRPAA